MGMYPLILLRLLVVLLSTIATLWLATACGGNGTPTRAPDTLNVHGLVVEVAAKSLTDLASLTVRDEMGSLWIFTAEGFVGMTPSHLTEHRLLGEPVTVSYKETPDGLVALRITD